MTEKIHALNVDDDIRSLHDGRSLERLGDFSVTTAPGAVEAIALLKEKQIDVIISDYPVPQMDGIDYSRSRFNRIMGIYHYSGIFWVLSGR